MSQVLSLVALAHGSFLHHRILSHNLTLIVGPRSIGHISRSPFREVYVRHSLLRTFRVVGASFGRILGLLAVAERSPNPLRACPKI